VPFSYHFFQFLALFAIFLHFFALFFAFFLTHFTYLSHTHTPISLFSPQTGILPQICKNFPQKNPNFKKLSQKLRTFLPAHLIDFPPIKTSIAKRSQLNNQLSIIHTCPEPAKGINAFACVFD